MHLGSCRLCEKNIINNPLLTLEGMPKSAQHFLNYEELPSRESITLNIYQCDNCGLVQLNLEPVSYYKNVITAASISKDARISRLKQMTDFANRFNLKDKKIIEIGCAKGDMLDIIEDAGMRAYGLEHSAESVLFAKNKNRKVIEGFIDDLDEIDFAPFSGFMCFNYLEHVPHPKSVIKKIYNNLENDGVGLVTVPNLNYLLETKSFYEFVADHLSYFTKDTLRNAFYDANFDILECSLINNENDILIIVRKKEKKIKKKIVDIKKINIHNDYKEVEILINNLKNLIQDYKRKKKESSYLGCRT